MSSKYPTDSSGALGLYSYSTLSSSTYSSGHSREPSYSNRSPIPISPYHTRESSGATRPPSIHEEAIRHRFKKHRDLRSSDEATLSSCDQQRQHHHKNHGRRGQRAYHSQNSYKRSEKRSSRYRRRSKHPELPLEADLVPQPPANKLVAVKSAKENKNTGNVTWRRFSQGLKIGKPKKVEPNEETPTVMMATQPRRKSKWKFWAKQELPGNYDSTIASPKTLKTRDELETKDDSGSRPSVLDWIDEEPLLHQSPTELKRLFEED
ncbi:Ff.00g110580.m01.CDS01 [Fusarium sp. VM40]|nr:Ff.00g110580.m01.CDS01 [Fusarium sp. VM40]